LRASSRWRFHLGDRGGGDLRGGDDDGERAQAGRGEEHRRQSRDGPERATQQRPEGHGSETEQAVGGVDAPEERVSGETLGQGDDHDLDDGDGEPDRAERQGRDRGAGDQTGRRNDTGRLPAATTSSVGSPTREVSRSAASAPPIPPMASAPMSSPYPSARRPISDASPTAHSTNTAR
jgi:hypothetical protein